MDYPVKTDFKTNKKLFIQIKFQIQSSAEEGKLFGIA